MNTGHDGSLTTLHANSPEEVATRLTMMARYAMDLPVDVITEQIVSALDLVVQVDRFASGERKVTSICEVGGSGQEGVTMKHLMHWSSEQERHIWQSAPSWMNANGRYRGITREEVHRWMDMAGLL